MRSRILEQTIIKESTRLIHISPIGRTENLCETNSSFDTKKPILPNIFFIDMRLDTNKMADFAENLCNQVNFNFGE